MPYFGNTKETHIDIYSFFNSFFFPTSYTRPGHLLGGNKNVSLSHFIKHKICFLKSDLGQKTLNLRDRDLLSFYLSSFLDGIHVLKKWYRFRSFYVGRYTFSAFHDIYSNESGPALYSFRQEPKLKISELRTSQIQ